MIDLWTPLPASLLAFATTAHVAFAVLRKHRTPTGTAPWAMIPSVALACGPWLAPSAAGVGLGLLAHGLWFFVCEWFIPKPVVAAGPPRPAVQPARPEPAARPAPGKDFIGVPVLAVLDESPSIRTFRMARPDGFVFQAGQFLTVRVQVDGQPHVRCYSISSAPECTGYLEISVKRQGLVSGTLHATVRPGSSLMVRPPAGKFVYPGKDDRPIVLVAGGVGITPLISMLRHAVAADPLRPVTLLYSARGARELALWDELRWLEQRHSQTRIVATLTESVSGWQGRVGRIDAALLAEYVENATHAVFMICGPAAMIGDVRHALEAMGVPAAQVRSEVFQAAAAIGARPQPTESESTEPEEVGPGGRPRLRLLKSNRTVDVDPRQTLLEAAEAANAPIPSLCRSGVCRTCRTRLVAGKVQCTSDALDEGDRTDGYTLPCVAWAKTDCSLDA